MTDQELKRAVANMLPERIEIVDHGSKSFHVERFYWKPYSLDHQEMIRDTEWLHVAWLVEKAINAEQCEAYHNELSKSYQAREGCPIDFYIEHWSWQERAIALCKVKGIEP